MEPLENPVYASEPVQKMTNGFGLTSMLLGFFNVALILTALVSFYGMVSAVNSANGVTIQDYEVLGEEEIERMFGEDAETAAPVAAMAAGLAGCLSVGHAHWIHLGIHWVDAIQRPKMGSILGLILNLPLLLIWLWHGDGTHAARRLNAVRPTSVLTFQSGKPRPMRLSPYSVSSRLERSADHDQSL